MSAFEEKKKKIETVTIKKAIDCLRVVTLNISEKCQLKCPSCPRSYGYPNQDLYMDVNTAYKIKQHLDKINFTGIVSISGMGEPCLSPLIYDIVAMFHPYKVQLITNGLADVNYRLLSNYADIIVSVHNTGYSNILEQKFRDVAVIFRNHDTYSNQCELIPTNRGGWLFNENKKDRVCYFPFYKVCIDYDGSYLLCPDDWRRISKKPDIDVFHMDLKTYFCDYIKDDLLKLITMGRLKSPCSECNANGMLMGKDIVEKYICQLENE